jgi:ABC-2 type transport system ATP-binding protein
VTTPVIDVQQVNKHFRLHHERHKSLKDRLLHPGGGTYTDLHALSDVSFAVGAGETVGILGRNGSGKSTILKCICGVLQPSSGRIELRGSLAGLLELGAGFQPELSGRDNVYLSGSMLGLGRKTIDRLFDDIVGFAELEHFIDTPVKFYSSGMYVRLGFAVAVTVDPDILVVDEVLAVGDERFQAKCMDRIQHYQRDGRTILLVSHNADQVRTLCDRAIVLDRGQLVADTTAGEGVRVFRERLLGQVASVGSDAETSGSLSIASVTTPSGSFQTRTDAPFRFTVGLHASEATAGSLVIEIHRPDGMLIARTDPTANHLDITPGDSAVTVEIPNLPLLDGSYEVSVGVLADPGTSVLAWRERAALLEVVYNGRGAGLLSLRPDVTPN